MLLKTMFFILYIICASTTLRSQPKHPLSSGAPDPRVARMSTVASSECDVAVITYPGGSEKTGVLQSSYKFLLTEPGLIAAEGFYLWREADGTWHLKVNA